MTPLNNQDPKFEKNYWIFILISMAILMAYPQIVQKFFPGLQQSQETAQAPAEPAAAKSSSPVYAPAPQIQDQNAELKSAGSFIEKPAVPEMIDYQNILYDVKFSPMGGSIIELTYKGEEGKSHLDHVRFFSGDNVQPGIFGLRLQHEPLDLSKVPFKFSRKSGENEIFEFIYEKPSEFRIIKQYILRNDQPVIHLDIIFENLSPRPKHFPIELSYGLDYGFLPDPHHHAEVEAVTFQEKIHSKKADKLIKKSFSVSGEQIEWAGLVRKYFAVLVKPDWKIIASDSRADDQTIRNTMVMAPVTVEPGTAAKQNFFIYAGPQRYELLKNMGLNFETLLSRGFFGVFKIWLLMSLKFFNQFVHNFGLAIILVTLVLKGLFTPLTHMSYESMRKMQALQPKLKSLQERYKKDPQKLNREMMELYKRNKVNPMGGCLPMLAQIPVFIAFYQVLNETIEMKGAPFYFWIKDLAEPDRLFPFPMNLPFLGDSFHLLPILMIGSMVWQQKLTPQAGSTPEQAKMMQFMPVVFGLLFYNMPSGLVLYWFVNNMLTILHQTVIKRMGAVVLHHEDTD